jgi:adenylate kinase family enzyme
VTIRRVCVYGPSGSGKSTLARALGNRLGLPVVELDAIYHARPGWGVLSPLEFRAAAEAVLAAHPHGWVVEGNYDSVRPLFLPHADLVVWLRLPWVAVYPRLVRRTFRRCASRELLWGGNRERWRDQLIPRKSMLWWGIAHWRASNRRTAAALASFPHGGRVVRLRSDREVRHFLASVAVAQGSSSP